MSEYIYVNIESTSFKIWGYDLWKSLNNGTSIIFLYRGRIGLPMEKLQKYKKTFDSFEKAEIYISKALKRKKHKGYIKVKYYPYFKLISKGKPLWELLRFIDITGQKIEHKGGQL